MSIIPFSSNIPLSKEDSYIIAQNYINYGDVKFPLSVVIFINSDDSKYVIGHITVNKNTVNTKKCHLVLRLLCGTFIVFDKYNNISLNEKEGHFSYNNLKFKITTIGNISYVYQLT